MLPHQGAVVHDLYVLIERRPCGVGAMEISQNFPLRLQWGASELSGLFEPMPVDWWTVHGYVLQEFWGRNPTEIKPPRQYMISIVVTTCLKANYVLFASGWHRMVIRTLLWH
jgi:hypothetical protein